MLKEEVTYYGGLPGHFKDGDVMYEGSYPKDTEELETDLYDREDL